MKKFFLFPVLLLFLFPVFSEDTETVSESVSTEESYEEPFADLFDEDSIFDDVEDVEAVITEEKSEKGEVVIAIDEWKIPLKFTGHMEADIGAGAIREDGETEKTGYFSFTNYLYFTARPDKCISINGSMKTYMPGSSVTFSLYELYFTYILLDKAFITAGKKKTTWGYTRLFTSYKENDTDDDRGGFSSDILYDSLGGTSMLLNVPVGTFANFSVFSLYTDSGSGSSSQMSMNDMSFAASAEFTVFNTALNFFARKYPSETGNRSSEYKRPLLGSEIKKTIFGTDFYVQGIGTVNSFSLLKEVDILAFYDLILTCGFYRKWENFGINVEYQEDYVTSSKEHYRAVAYDIYGRIKYSNKSIKIGASGSHIQKDSSGNNYGYVKPGVILSGFFPYADLDTGLKIQYGDTSSYVSPKLTFGSYLAISMDY
ncbi:MAG: hypothetical protein K6F69_02880 [Treponema sp.]|nr:hypothetical protein [Treponema sp.]